MRFSVDSDVKQALTSWLQTFDTDSYMQGKCLYINSDYTEVWCAPSAKHVPCIHQIKNSVLGMRVVVILFFETQLYKPQQL